MYKLYLLILCAIACASCGKEYKINGVSSMSSLDGKMLFIKVPSGESLVNIDSAEVIHGLFKMQGNIDSTMLAYLYMDDDYCIMPLVIENGRIEIKIDNASFTVKGTPLNDRFNDFLMKKNSLDDKAFEVERLESRMIMDGKDPQTIREEITRKREDLGKESDSLLKTFIQENYENVLGAGIFIMVCNGFPYPIMTPAMEEIMNNAPESFRNNPAIKEYAAVARNRKERMQGIH